MFKGRRPVAQNKLRYATSFELWYGKRRVLARAEFPFKRVGERREFLLALIEGIERKRQRILKKRRSEYRKRRHAEARKAVERRVHRTSRKAPKIPRIPEPYRSSFVASTKMALDQLPVFTKLRAEKPVVARRAIVQDTIIIPMEPVDDTYKIRIVDKMLANHIFGEYHLAILDYTLKEKEFIPMSAEDFEEAYALAFVKFIPHVVNYFEQVRNSSDMFILRIKFLHQWGKEEDLSPHGVSFHRIGVYSNEQMIDLFRRTFLRMFGDKDDPYTTKNIKRANYLTGDSTIFITGFTLEAADVDKEKRDKRKIR